MPFERHHPAYNPHPNHNHLDLNSDLNVHVTGGDRVERELLVDAISSTMKKRGFEGVKAIAPHGYNSGNENVPPKTIFDTVAKMRPDLLTKDITITSYQDTTVNPHLGPVGEATITGSSKDGKTYTSKEGLQSFLAEASDIGATDKFVVSGMDPRIVTKAAAELLTKSPGSEVTMKVELQPWQMGMKRLYVAPSEPDGEKNSLGQPVANLVEYDAAPMVPSYPY